MSLLRAARAVALAGVIAAALALIALRIYVEPIFGPSDENDHFDYTISIARAGHLLSAHNALGFPSADLESAFLETYADFPRIYLNPGERVPAGPPAYGSHQYYRKIDLLSKALLPDPAAYLNAPDHPNPVLVSMYPFAYYAANAAWLAAFAHADPSLSATFFAARWFSAMLVALALAFTYGVSRELGMARVAALGFTAIAGCFALTTFVGAYVQPDDLTLVATVATFYFALRLRRARAPYEWVALACALGVLCVTKYQVALCVAIATAPAVAYFYYRRCRSTDRLQGLVVLVALPAVVLLAIQTLVVGTNAAFEKSLGTHFVFGGLATLGPDTQHFIELLGQAIWYYFVGNVTPPLTHDYRYASALSYWNYFGNLDTYVTLGSPAVDRIARATIVLGTMAAAALGIAASVRFLRRIVRVARRGRAATALQLVLSNVPLNAYYAFVVFMVVFYALTNNNWRQSGRNWLPFIVPALLLAVRFGPQALRDRRARAAVAGVFFVLLGLYSTAGSYYAASAVQERYYGDAALPPLARLARGPSTDILIGHVGAEETDVAPAPVMPVMRGRPIEIEGVASDFAVHGPAGGVIGVVDGRDEVAASYQYAHQDVADRVREPSLFWAGFHLTIPTANIGLGPHRVAFYVVSKDRKRAFRTPRSVHFELVGAGPSRPAAIQTGEYRGFVEKILPLTAEPPDGAETTPVVLAHAQPLYLQGWLVDLAHGLPLRGIDAVVDGRQRVTLHVGDLRPELRAAFPKLAPLTAASAGFSGIVETNGLPAGAHRISLVATDATGRKSTVLADFPVELRTAHPPDAVEPAPVSLPLSFVREGDYVGSLDAVAPLRDERYWNPQTSPIWVPAGEPLVVRGWGVDLAHVRPLAAIDVSLDGARPIAVLSGDTRPDVVVGLAKLPASATAPSGFSLLVPTRGLATGMHALSVTMLDPRTGHTRSIAERVPFTVY